MKYLLLAVLAFFACSCATVVRGTSETAKFESTPTGADVTAESVSEDKQGPYYCVTPCELELKRKRTWKVDFSLEGYKPVSGLLKPVVTGGGVAAGAGNVLLGGLIGVGIDAGTGANMDLRPNPMIAELASVDSPEISRILDAEIVSDEQVEEAGAEAADEVEVPADMGEPQEAPSVSDETNDIEPETDAPVEESDGGAPVAVGENEAKGANVNAEPAQSTAIAVSQPLSATPDHAAVRFYKPGEVAPNDEEADDLNRMQLDGALSEN